MRFNSYVNECCEGKFAGEVVNLCDVCDSPLPRKDIPLGADLSKLNTVEVKKETKKKK